ncbi:MAG TPA: hypothetical protein VEA39_02535 [Methylophilaceae bacterium]|nr:hypothetical protein [Methylophilaceae bacterium]
MIYQKSALGMHEIFSSDRSLTTRERQVLVLIDGKRSTDELEVFFDKKHLREILVKLEQLGFTHPLDGQTPVEHTPTHATNYIAESRIALSPVQMDSIKQILINGAEDYLGIMGRSLKEKVQTTTDFKKLRNFISLWHMSMRESKLGRESAGYLMQQINQIIESTAQTEDGPILQPADLVPAY